MSTEHIRSTAPQKATLTLSDADDLRLFGGLTYIVGLLSCAATLHQNAIYTHTKLINNDIEVQKELNNKLLHVGTVDLDGIKQTHYRYVDLEFRTQAEHYSNITYVKCYRALKDGEVPNSTDIYNATEHLLNPTYLGYKTRADFNTCKQQTKLNDAISQGKVLQECRDAIQTRYSQTSKTAEMNDGDVLKFIRDVNQLTAACGSVLDTLTKVTNVMVIPV
jgi:hypothetical protein